MIARLRLLALAVLAVMLCAAPARAQQQFSWTNYCTVGSLQFCASVELVLTPDATGSTTLMSIRMRNLEGTLGTTPWRMGGTGFFNFKANTGWGSIMTSGGSPGTFSGTAGFYVNAGPVECDPLVLGPCPGPFWGYTDWEGETNPLDTMRASWRWTGYNIYHQMDIVGCDVPTVGNPLNTLGSFQTCGDGWIGVVFTLPGNWIFDGASSVSWYALSDQGNTSCTVDVDCFASTVTPEPVTIVLLGSGLMGIGAFKRRRRADEPG